MAAAEATPAADCLPRQFVFVDLETTGASPGHDRIIEVAIVRMAGAEVIEEWSSLVDPECPIPANITAFTGISDAMVRGAPTFAALATTIVHKLADAMFVAHNARFDYSFMHRELKRASHEFSPQVLCTVKLSRRLFPQFVRHNLDAVMQRHGIQCAARHRALGDAQVLRDFWRQLYASQPPRQLAAAIAQSLLEAPKLPAQLPPQLADELPDNPGVYRYYGADGALLYVGRAASLRQRVLSQLGEPRSGSGEPRSGSGEPRRGSRDQRLAAEVHRVEWLVTAGELGAMLREAALIRRLEPRHNRHAKQHGGEVTWRPSPDGSGRFDCVPLEELDGQQLAATFGVFRASKDARKALGDIARARGLCLKVLGLETADGACLAYPLGKCKGACIGREALLLHQARAVSALVPLKLKSWPFPGRIALRELTGLGEELHVLEHWSYLGSARSEQELDDLRHVPSAGFDLDVYRILLRYLTQHRALDWCGLRPVASPS